MIVKQSLIKHIRVINTYVNTIVYLLSFVTSATYEIKSQHTTHLVSHIIRLI